MNDQRAAVADEFKESNEHIKLTIKAVSLLFIGKSTAWYYRAFSI